MSGVTKGQDAPNGIAGVAQAWRGEVLVGYGDEMVSVYDARWGWVETR